MEYGIKKLPHGYLVSDSKEWIAAFSNFENMALWLSERFDTDETWDKAPDGWIDWKAGEPPAIAKGTPIIVRHRDGEEFKTVMFGRGNVRWNRMDEAADIVAYRVVNDGWIEWFGGKEPDAQYVEVRFADGGVRKDRPGLFYGWDFTHPHSKENPDKRIVAYRVVTP